MIREADHEAARKLLRDRRKALRFPIQLHATCHTGGGKTGVQWPALVRNISRVGAGLVLPRSFSAGTQFTVCFQGGTARVALMRVTHSHAEGNGYYHGCAFVLPLADAEVEALSQAKPPCPAGHQIRGIPCVVERMDDGKVVTYSAKPDAAATRNLSMVLVMGYASESAALAGLERQLVRLEVFKQR